MADLVAANLSVAQNFLIDRGMDRLIRTFPTLTFGDSALTYPAGGIPLPDKSKFGLKAEVKRAYVEQPIDGYVYAVDRAAWKLLIFTADYNAVADGPLIEATGLACAPTTLNLEMVGQ